MHLTSAKIANFGLIKDSQVSIIPNDFTLIAGEHLSGEMGTLSIGSGKTTFLSALWWGLTNELIYKSRDYLASDIIGPFGKSAQVELSLSGGDKSYKIIRKRDKSGYSVTLFEDDLDISSKDNTLTEQLIQEKLGVNWEIFRYSNYIPQEDSKTGFLYASDKTRRQLVTQLYHQQFFDSMYKAFNISRKEADRELLSKEHAASLLEGQLQQAEIQASQLQTELDRIKLNNLKVDEVLTDVDRPTYILRNIDQKRAAIERAESRATKARELAKDASQRAAEASVGLASLEAEVQAIQHQQEGVLERLQEMKAQLRTKGFCPLCRTEMTEQAMLAVKKACNKEIKSYKALECRLGNLLESKEDLGSQVRAAKEERQKHDERVKQMAKIIKRNSEAMVILQKNYNLALEDAQKRIDPGPIERALESANDALRELHKKIVEHEWSMSITRKSIGRLTIWEDAYNTTIRSMAFESVIDRFAMLVDQKLSMMYGDNMSIRFDTKKTEADNSVQDKFVIQIKDRDMGNWKGVVFASGGQKRIISLAIAMSMMELSNPRLALYMIDEGLEGVDPTVARNALGSIRSMAKSMSVLFVTHSTEVPAGERRIVAIRKDGAIDLQ